MTHTKEMAIGFVSGHPELFKKDWRWFDKNWSVVAAFERKALQLISLGRTHYSARTIVEVLVHESVVSEVDGEYKIGNDNAPDLARLFVVLHPEHINFWEYRRGNHEDFVEAIESINHAVEV